MIEFLLIGFLILGSVDDRETIRFRYSWEQGFDASCGLQALACLLGLYWGEEASEAGLASALPPGAVERRTSFADMEALLAARGFACAAYALDYGQLEGAAARYAPLVAHYDKPLGHFVLVLTARDGMLVVADPASGLQRLERRDFEARWDGYVLLAARPGAAPRRGVLDAAVASALAPARLLDFEARRELRVRP